MVTSHVMPWSLDPEGLASVREDLLLMRLCIKSAILRACALDPRLAAAAEQLLAALEPALTEIHRRGTVAVLHLDGAAERAQRKQNAAERALAVAEREIQTALAGLQAELLRASEMPTASNRWQPRRAAGGFNPHGFFVYCLWGDDAGRPIYVGQSRNVLSRLGTHVNGKGTQIRHVTLLRCRSARQMDETESRMIAHYKPPLNVQGIRPVPP